MNNKIYVHRCCNTVKIIESTLIIVTTNLIVSLTIVEYPVFMNENGYLQKLPKLQRYSCKCNIHFYFLLSALCFKHLNNIFFSFILDIRSEKSDLTLPFSSLESLAEWEEFLAVSSSTSSTLWRGSSKRKLISMNICLVLIFKSFYPFDSFGYPINTHSILCG